MSKNWVIGSAQECDLRSDLPGVSGRHCRLSLSDDGGYFLEDLKSTNGTFVNGERLSSSRRVTRSDTVTLGQSALMPWPSDPMSELQIFRLGRDSDNDVVIDQPMVSGLHARVLWEPKTRIAWIEDLGSANGTSVGEPGRKTGRLRFSNADTIYLGSQAIPAAWLLTKIGVRPESSPMIRSETMIDGRDAPDDRVLTSSHFACLFRKWSIPILLAHAVLIAVVLVVAGGGFGARLKPPAVKVASTLYWLSLATVWFGLASVVMRLLVDPAFPIFGRRDEALAERFGRVGLLATISAGQCVLALVIVEFGVGLAMPGVAAIAFMVLASLVGLALACLIVAVTRKTGPTLAAILTAVVLMGVGTTAPAVAGALPTRWCFEGLLLLEAGAGTSEERAKAGDLAEPYFSATSDRSGLTVCTIALGFMFVGIAASAVFISWESESISRPHISWRDPVLS